MEKIYELEAFFIGIEAENSQIGLTNALKHAYVEISCNFSTSLIRQKQKGSLLISVEEETFLQIFLKHEGKSLANFSVKVQLLCEKRLTGDFSKKFKFLYQKNHFFVNISGFLRLFKAKENNKKASKGAVQDFQELIENHSKIQELLKGFKSQLKNEFGVELTESLSISGKTLDLFEDPFELRRSSCDLNGKSEVFNQKSLNFTENLQKRGNSLDFRPSSSVSNKNSLFSRENFFVSRENLGNESFESLDEKNEKVNLLNLIISLQTRIKDLKNDSCLVQELENCLAQINSNNFEPVLPTVEESKKLEDLKESLIQENTETLKELERNKSSIQKIEPLIENLRKNCEKMQKDFDEERSKYKISKIQQEISELSENFVKSQENCFHLSDTLKQLLEARPSSGQIDTKQKLLSEKYELLEDLHKKTILLDRLQQESSSLKLSLLESSELRENSFSLEQPRNDLNSLCTQSAKLVYDAALSIKSLEDFCSELRSEVESCKRKVSEKDSEYNKLQKISTQLQKANKSTRQLIEKDLKETSNFLDEFLETNVSEHDVLLNELDFLSNLTLLQTVTWHKQASLHSSLKSRLRDLEEEVQA